MSAPEKRTRAQERLLAASRPRGERLPTMEPAPHTIADPANGTDPGSEPAQGESKHHLSIARTEGLELAEQLGSGRGTRTWLAKEEQSREKFTVTFATGPTAQGRLQQQLAMAGVAQEWAGSVHPHLVPVRGAISASDCVEALVCAHVDGMSLAHRMAQDGRVSPVEISPILTAAAKGLATLHDHGWVHGSLGPNCVLIGQDQQVWLDGYGVPVPSGPAAPNDEQSAERAAVSWGQDDRPEMLERGYARTPADDVKALATLAWLALTGRAPGTDSHRVPLTLVCPTAPRGLVLMLEAALCDDPETRPTAREFATGIAALPPAKAPPKSARRTPEIIRADGSEVKLGRTWHTKSREGTTSRDRSRSMTATVFADRPWRRPLVLALAATALVGCAWFGVAEVAGGNAVAELADHGNAVQDGVQGGSAEANGPQDGVASPGASVPSATAGDATPLASPDEGLTNSQEAAANAARELVASRADALAAADSQALTAVYVPGSRRAESDQATIERAVSQDGGASDYTALSGLSMTVDRIAPVSVSTPESDTSGESRDGAVHTFYAEILTRGWHGEIPKNSYVNREDATVRQTVHLTVTETKSGWRIVDVTPVERQG